MTGWPFGKCQRCGVTVFPFALSCPNCHAPSLRGRMAAFAALAAVLLGAGLIALAWHSFRGINEATSVPPTPSSSEPSDTAQAYDWIVKAMAQCEEEAKLSPDTLRFLIVPVIATGIPQPGWSPSMVGTIGQVGALLQATDTVIGLRNGALVLYQG